MGNWNLGSAMTEIVTIVPDVPSNVSGTNMLALIDRVRFRMERYTGDSIGSVSIAEKYQPALVDLSVAEVIGIMQLTGADKNISIGDFSIGTAGTNLSETREHFYSRGMQELRELGKKMPFSKSNG